MPISQYTIPQFIVDAFTDTVFKGNPAAVCLLDEWLSDNTLQNIAKENNLSETAFTVKKNGYYDLRWFTPGGEIDLCGHATLATAFVLFQFIEVDVDSLTFTTQSGELLVTKRGELYELNFPVYSMHQVPVTSEMEEAIGIRPLEAWLGRDLVCILPHENDVIAATPDCGSGHCHVIPLWAKKLGQEEFRAYQASKRSGHLICRLEGDRLYLAGKAALYSRGEIYVTD